MSIAALQRSRPTPACQATSPDDKRYFSRLQRHQSVLAERRRRRDALPADARGTAQGDDVRTPSTLAALPAEAPAVRPASFDAPELSDRAAPHDASRPAARRWELRASRDDGRPGAGSERGCVDPFGSDERPGSSPRAATHASRARAADGRDDSSSGSSRSGASLATTTVARWARRGLAPGGAPQDARRLGRVLPRAAAHAQRYFEESEAEVPASVPAVRRRDAGAAARPAARRFSSAFAVDCEACGEALRPPGVRRPDPGRTLALRVVDLREADDRVTRITWSAGDFAVVELARGRCAMSSGRRISGLSCSISRGESSPSVFTSTLSMTASKTRSRGP